MSISDKQYLGFGLGFRPNYLEEIILHQTQIEWLEVLTDDYLLPTTKAKQQLEQIRALFPLAAHGVALSIGSADPLNWNYIKQLKAFKENYAINWLSEHLCFKGVQQINTHDLLPLPYTEEAINYISDRILAVQEYLGDRLVIENVSSYITYQSSQMLEYEFLAVIAKKADCLLLVDINNIFVSSFNHGLDPYQFIDHLPAERVQQIHLAGHQHFENYLLDTHDQNILPEVWQLYEYANQKFGLVSTMIERDGNFPPFIDLLNELNYAKKIAQTNLIAAELI